MTYWTPFGVTPRDFVELWQLKSLESCRGSTTANTTGFVILGRTVDHKDAPCPKDHIRGTTYSIGYLLKQTHDGNGNIKCTLTGIANQHYGGSVPKLLLSFMHNTGFKNWVDLFVKTCMKESK